MIKVVIADDEEKVCQLICRLIDWDSLGMEIVGTAQNGLAALELLERESPDILITDIRMPGLSGLEMIKRVKELHTNLDFVIISGYSQFEYAQSAIKFGVSDYLLKPIKKNELTNTLLKLREKYRTRTEQLSREEELKIRLKSDLDKLRNRFFLDFCVGREENMQLLSLMELNTEYHFHFQKGAFQIAVIKTDCGLFGSYDGWLKMVEGKMERLLQNALQDICFDLEICFFGSRAYCLMNFAIEEKKNVRKHLKAVLDEMVVQKSLFHEVEFTMGLGPAVLDIRELKKAKAGVDDAVGKRLLLGTGRFYELETERAETGDMAMVQLAFKKAVEAGLELLDREAVAEALLALREGLLAEEKNGRQMMLSVLQAYETFLAFMRGIAPAAEPGGGEYSRFAALADQCGSFSVLFGYLEETILSRLDQVIAERDQAESKPIRIAKQYIQKNYRKPLSLEEVSRVAGFNPTYFSTLFKKESGSNFLEYLSEIRMNHAKALLKETNLSVAKICEQVGYNDIKHFTRSFKKLTALSPNEYRKLYS